MNMEVVLMAMHSTRDKIQSINIWLNHVIYVWYLSEFECFTVLVGREKCSIIMIIVSIVNGHRVLQMWGESLVVPSKYINGYLNVPICRRHLQMHITSTFVLCIEMACDQLGVDELSDAVNFIEPSYLLMQMAPFLPARNWPNQQWSYDMDT